MDGDKANSGGSNKDMANFGHSSGFGVPGQMGFDPAAEQPQPQPQVPEFAQLGGVPGQAGFGFDGSPVQPLVPAAPRQSVDNNTTVSVIADDGDLIEKEWVIKAKNIVENTRFDPYLQSQKLSELRQEYLQKRYGKTIEKSD